MSGDEHGCAPTREHHQDESEGSRVFTFNLADDGRE